MPNRCFGFDGRKTDTSLRSQVSAEIWTPALRSLCFLLFKDGLHLSSLQYFRYDYIRKLYSRRWHLADDETACVVVASSRHISGFYYVTKPNEVLGRDQIAVLEGESHRVWEPECWTVVSVPNENMRGGRWGCGARPGALHAHSAMNEPCQVFATQRDGDCAQGFAEPNPSSSRHRLIGIAMPLESSRSQFGSAKYPLRQPLARSGLTDARMKSPCVERTRCKRRLNRYRGSVEGPRQAETAVVAGVRRFVPETGSRADRRGSAFEGATATQTRAEVVELKNPDITLSSVVIELIHVKIIVAPFVNVSQHVEQPQVVGKEAAAGPGTVCAVP